MTDTKLTINPDYVVGQLARALATAEGHADSDVRERAEEKVRKWQQVFEGMIEGSLRFGSRTPVAAAPAWVTLEVAHGGFATGSFMAGGELEPHEIALHARLEASDAPGRTALNLFYLTDKGREELLETIRTGRFRISVPEEGALPTVAWLIARGAPDDAWRVLEAVAPFFDRLRFFPAPHARPIVAGATVRLQSIGETAKALRATKQQPHVLAMNEALAVWAPLYDRAVALFLETVEDGWPCRTYPAGWADRAKTLLDDYARARVSHWLCGKPERKKENFARLRGYLAIAASDASRLTGRDVGMIRKILVSFTARHGAPGSARHGALHARQAEVAAIPTHGALRAVVVERLAGLPPDDGIPAIDMVGGVVTAEEAAHFGVPSGSAMPDSVARKLQRSLEGPVEDLVAQGVIPSAEVLGVVLPQLTSRVRAAGLSDPDLRRLYSAVYGAFRRRRSLPLLDLAHQVRLEELPWIAAMSRFRQPSTSDREAAYETLRELTLLAVASFPHTILPNKLVRELKSLAKSAEVDLPLVEELAADIFMGEFSEKFLRAAHLAAKLLEGTLYERYYGISYDEVLRIDDVRKANRGAPSSPGFAALCRRLAGTDATTNWSVAKNGKVIEQEQIVTTHNLAPLFVRLDLARTIPTELPELATRCFRWICGAQQTNYATMPAHARLVMMKNAAYAWRQMLFFLSMAPQATSEFVRWAEEHLATQSAPFQARFAPAMRGLRFVADGGVFDAGGTTPNGGRRFLGWTTERHWMFGPAESDA